MKRCITLNSLLIFATALLAFSTASAQSLAADLAAWGDLDLDPLRFDAAALHAPDRAGHCRHRSTDRAPLITC